MKKVRKSALCFLMGMGLFFVFICSADGGNIDPGLQTALQSRLPDEELPVIIKLSERAQTGLIRDNDRRIRRYKIIRELKDKASMTQVLLKGFLEGRNARKMRTLWIINSISVTIPARVVAEIAAFPKVESIGLDYPIKSPVTTYAVSALPEWNIAAVKAPDVWNLGHRGTGVVVANVDTGVDLFHPDLQGKWRGGANSWYDPNGEHATPYDSNGHGTSTMGIMTGGSEGGTAIGIAPEAQWIAVKLFNDAGGSSLSRVHEAFQWLLDPDDNPATDDAPDVVNASWGLLNSSGQCIADFQTDIQNLRAAGIAVVFSGGNSGPQVNTSESPANNAGSFAVGATDGDNLIASFSSRGPSACGGDIFPHVTAPGVNIRTSDLTAGGVILNSYAYVSGTSFAAPHVAGAIALLLSAFPGATVDEIESALRQSASDYGAPGSDNEYGFGFINILAAYTILLDTSAQAVIEVSPISHDFGTVEISNDSAPRIFQITNAGTADLSIGSIALTGPNASDFGIVSDGCSGRTVTPQEQCALATVFSPGSIGFKAANLVIPSNDPDHPSVDISLNGTGFLPPLRISSPDGGENWAAGTTVVIRWTYTGNPGYWVKIELLRAGLLNKTIMTYASAGNGGSGSYTWKIPDNQTPDTRYQIRVTSRTSGTYTDTSNAYFTISAPPPPSITVSTPNGGENWNAGATNTIRWTYTGNPGRTVKIELYKAGQLNRTISSYASIGSNGSGTYNWAIPSTQPSGSDYTIKIKSTTNSSYADTSDASFTLNGPPPPSITVTAPNGGETWRKSTGQTIRWTYTGNAGSYAKIELLKGGAVNRVISAYARMGSGGAGSYYWYIPYNQASGDDYQIRITSISNSSVADTGNGFFTIP
jgi:subtilisin family serine protease